MKKIHRVLSLFLFCSFITACSSISTVIVNFKIEGEVNVYRNSLDTPKIKSIPFEASKIYPGQRSPFPRLSFTDPLLKGELLIDSYSTSFTFTNLSKHDIIFRFDQASISSNFEVNPMPLITVISSVHGVRMLPQKVDPYNRPLIAVPSMKLTPNEKGGASFPPSYRGIFPSSRIFNIITNKQTLLSQSGIGNTMIFHLPIEFQGKREIWVFHFKAVDESASVGYP